MWWNCDCLCCWNKVKFILFVLLFFEILKIQRSMHYKNGNRKSFDIYFWFSLTESAQCWKFSLLLILSFTMNLLKLWLEWVQIRLNFAYFIELNQILLHEGSKGKPLSSKISGFNFVWMLFRVILIKWRWKHFNLLSSKVWMVILFVKRQYFGYFENKFLFENERSK